MEEGEKPSALQAQGMFSLAPASNGWPFTSQMKGCSLEVAARCKWPHHWRDGVKNTCSPFTGKTPHEQPGGGRGKNPATHFCLARQHFADQDFHDSGPARLRVGGGGCDPLPGRDPSVLIILVAVPIIEVRGNSWMHFLFLFFFRGRVDQVIWRTLLVLQKSLIAF